MNWQQWAFFVVGIIIGILIGLSWANEKITSLRVALGDLVREDTLRWYSTEPGGWHGEQREALERARKVLEQ